MKKNVKNDNKICVAITGSLCSGKTFVLNLFKNLGYQVFSFDDEVSDLLKNDQEIKREVLSNFPDALDNGEVSKKKLAEIVFADRKKLEFLEISLKKKLDQRRDAFIVNLDKDQTKIAFFEAPLLFERNNQDKYDFIIVTHAASKVCKKRAISRGISEQRYQQITSLQTSPDTKRKMSDYVIDTDCELKDINKQIQGILADING